MKVESPLGEYQLQLRRVEWKDGRVTVVGLVAGIESSILIEGEDLLAGLRKAGRPLVGLLLIGLWCRRSARAG